MFKNDQSKGICGLLMYPDVGWHAWMTMITNDHEKLDDHDDRDDHDDYDDQSEGICGLLMYPDVGRHAWMTRDSRGDGELPG